MALEERGGRREEGGGRIADSTLEDLLPHLYPLLPVPAAAGGRQDIVHLAQLLLEAAAREYRHLQMCGYAGVQVCRCAGVQVCRCAGVQVCRCAGSSGKQDNFDMKT